MTRHLLRTAALLVALALPLAAGAQPAPYRHWRTLDTPHFRVHAPAGLEREGRVAGAVAERAYALLARELVAPRGPIELVVSDDADYSNGAATPYPTNRIFVYATPPVEEQGLRLNEDWLGLVITHELTHIFHLDRTRGVWTPLQRVFGRVPYFFPNVYSPSWLTEGLAVYYESRLTNGGRLASGEHRAIARAAALEGALPHVGDLSLGSPLFPGGERTYSYGSLFLEYLARTHGDSSVPRFVERQSAALVPMLQEGAARGAFGERFDQAFDRWRDSVLRDARTATPTAGWRELTTHPYYAVSPRWVNDTTLVYTGTDGRESNSAFTVTTSGVRRRLGRRASQGANVPLPDGGLLFAQQEYAGTAEVRSDLYVERDGALRRLTHGARLIQPDMRGASPIVAVQVAAARTSLVLVDREGRVRTLRAAGPDETWSEPRWSPDGRAIVAVHRMHGGTSALELLDSAGASVATLVTRAAIIASPSFTRDGDAVLYVSEESGAAAVYRVAVAGSRRGEVTAVRAAPTALLFPEQSPDGRLLAASLLRADGYHLVAAPMPEGGAPVTAPAPAARADSQPLAPGEYRAYSAGRTLVPRWWLPVFESAPGGDMRFGAMTAGEDVVGRHSYAAYVALSDRGRPTGALSYRYAGLRRPFVDVNLSRDYTDEGRVVDDAGASLGTLLRRTHDLSIAASWQRPRMRTWSALSAGLGIERRLFVSDPVPLLALLDASYGREYSYPRAFVTGAFSNARYPRLAVSAEDGVSLAFTARERYRTDAAARTASLTVIGTATGYRSLDLPGFAHHVLALRTAGGWADARASTSLEVGGTSGATVDVAPGLALGEGRRTFGVRGFPAASIYGTQAAAGSLEYRAPLLLGGQGGNRIPWFFDRSSLSAFADAGTAGCASAPLYRGVCSPAPVIGRTIASAGAELGLSAALLDWDSPMLLRFGVAVPIAGRRVVSDNVAPVAASSVYVAAGHAF